VNNDALKARNESVGAAFSEVAQGLALVGEGTWRLTLRNGAPHAVTATAGEDWLVLEAGADPDGTYPGLFWDAATRNGSLGGLVKFVLAGDGRLRLRAEVPLPEGVVVAARIREVCGGFESACMSGAAPARADGPPIQAVGALDLKALCSEAGWPFVVRGDGRLAVELEVPGSYAQALLAPWQRGVGVSCEIAAFDSLEEVCRPAVGGLLLAASGLVRLGRAAVRPDGAVAVAQFEVRFESAPAPLEISSALECLSVACSLCGEEAKTLQLPAVAERYLALRGWGADAAARPNERKLTA
jgi:hypothetical protein